jgi:hypothetical protein
MRVSAVRVMSDSNVRENAAKSLVAGKKVFISSSTHEIDAAMQAYRSLEFAPYVDAGRVAIAEGRIGDKTHQQNPPIILISAAGGALAGGSIAVLLNAFRGIHPAGSVAVDAASVVLGALTTGAVAAAIKGGRIKSITVEPRVGKVVGLEFAATF